MSVLGNTLGKMSQSRNTWGNIKPVTQVKQSKKLYSRKKDKQKFKNGDY